MAEILPAIAQRFACRAFSGEAVSEAELESILEAGRLAPSGFGMEPWRFIVLRTGAAKAAVTSACFDQPAAATAPLLVAIVALVGELRPQTAYVHERLLAEAGGPVPDELRSAYEGFFDQTDMAQWAVGQCGYAAMQMMLQATALGLASCPIGGFDEKALAAALQLPSGERPALVLALGHCTERQGERRRKPVGEVWERR